MSWVIWKGDYEARKQELLASRLGEVLDPDLSECSEMFLRWRSMLSQRTIDFMEKKMGRELAGVNS